MQMFDSTVLWKSCLISVFDVYDSCSFDFEMSSVIFVSISLSIYIYVRPHKCNSLDEIIEVHGC